MPKRRRCEEDDSSPGAKRARTGTRICVLDLSNEILLRIFTLLPIGDLLHTESVCLRFHALATDREVWKTKYYDAWIRPRARRLPLQDRHDRQRTKAARWRENNHKLRDGSAVDWKRQFKVRRNWTAGMAKVHEVEVAQTPSPPVIAKMHKGVTFTVDSSAGLRAWSQARVLVAEMQLPCGSEPSCMAVDVASGANETETSILLGFADGMLRMYVLLADGHFERRLTHQSTDGALAASALSLPYTLTISHSKILTIYHVKPGAESTPSSSTLSPLARLHSDASFTPVCLGLRKTKSQVIASVVYSFHRIQSGWCIGLQEIRLTTNGVLIDCRLASALDTPFDTQHQGRSRWDMSTRSASSLPLPLHPPLMSPPSSLSYDHPFLISTLADNTIMSFLVTSDERHLEISAGRRLWGHTSAVSGAEVNNRGKAVSISRRGNEIRVWELESVMTSSSQPRTSTQIQAVDAISTFAAAWTRRGSGLGLALHEMKRELRLSRRWVGFDDEQVVVLSERRDQKQVISVYDFT